MVITHVEPDRSGPPRRSSSYFIIFRNWLNTVLASNKTKKGVFRNRGRTVIDLIFLLFLSVAVSACWAGASRFSALALLRWRMRRVTVAGDAVPESLSMRHRVFFLPRRRVAPKNICGRGSGRLKLLVTSLSLSLLHVKVHETPLY